MKITRYEHSCLLVEENGVKVLADLGSWNAEVPDVTGLSAVLITHEHTDHFDIDKLKTLLEKNPDAVIVTHAAVAVKLAGTDMTCTVIEPGGKVEVNGIAIESYGTDHAIIYGATSPCTNTGFLVAGKLFIPGDALHDIPPKPVEVLALPTGGPWMKMSEAIDYAKAVAPKITFPIHDAMYTAEYRTGGVLRWIASNLEPGGTRFVNLQPGESAEF